MDAYDCEQIDKRMSKRVEAVFSNPQRHKFYSFYEYYQQSPAYGPRGGRVVGKKSYCVHCGMKKKGHTDKTEDL